VTTQLAAILAMRRHAPDGTVHGPDGFVFGNACGERIKSIKKPWQVCVLKANGITPAWIKGGKNQLSAASRDAYREADLHVHDLRRDAEAQAEAVRYRAGLKTRRRSSAPSRSGFSEALYRAVKWLTGSVRPTVPSVKRFGCLLNIFGPDEQVSSSNRWIHSPCVVRPNHGLNPGFVQNALRDLGIRR
jgi:hypothetical protein